MIVIWALTGPIFGFSDTWQLVINTGTTIVTFLMVFLIQNSQNHDTVAIQLQLAELIRANQAAHNAFADMGDVSEEELHRIKSKFENLARNARQQVRQGIADVGCPEPVADDRQSGEVTTQSHVGQSNRTKEKE